VCNHCQKDAALNLIEEILDVNDWLQGDLDLIEKIEAHIKEKDHVNPKQLAVINRIHTAVLSS